MPEDGGRHHCILQTSCRAGLWKCSAELLSAKPERGVIAGAFIQQRELLRGLGGS